MPNAGAKVLASDYPRWKCQGTQTTLQSVATGTPTAITMNGADDVDDLGIHDPVTNNSRFVIGLALGWWDIAGIVWWATGATATRRGAYIYKNGAAVAGVVNIGWAANGTAAGSASVEGLVQAGSSTDYVELMGYQDTGGALNTGVASPFRSMISALYQGA